MTRIVLSALALLLVVTAAGASAQTLTGQISGRVTDAQGGALPGVVVTLVSTRGEQTQTTNELGDFRFLGLETGIYEVRTMLNGFKPRNQSNLEITIGKSIDLKLALEVGGVTEAVTVVGSTAKVDTTTTATDTSISQALLFNMPISRANPAVSMLNYAPGINSSSAFGGASGTANALLVDGVDVRDPEAGTPWVFFNYNIIDQVQVGALGQTAEMGGFSGAVINTVTKSGGNRFTGLFEHRYSSKSLRGNNVKGRSLNGSLLSSQNASLKVTGIDKLNDYTVQLGGPIKQNKAFFFGSVQRYSIKEDPDGPRTIRTEVSPRFNGKVTLQPSAADNFVVSFQYDNYNQLGRTGQGGTAGTTDFGAIQQDSPEWIYNGQYRRVLGNSAVAEAKFTGYWGYFDLDPVNPTPARFDGDTLAWLGGGGYSAQYDRTRNQLNASLSKYAELKGTHAFKFGVELERSTIRNRSVYTDCAQCVGLPAGQRGVYFVEYGGVPAYAYSYGYDVKGRNDRLSAFAQDQWQIGRLTVNAGVRMDNIKGIGSSDKKTYYDVSPIAPRLGFAFDVFGDGKSVLRAYYGQLYDGAVFTSWSNALPGIGDYVTYEAHGNYPNPTLVEIDRVSGASKYTMLDDIKHPRTDEISVAYERELSRGLKVTGTYIRRDAKNFISSTLIGGRWAPATINNPLTNTPLTYYRWANRFASNGTCASPPCVEQKFQIGNVDNFAYNGAPPADAYRTYNGAMFVLQRALQNRWQAQISYVYSKTKGTVTNGGTSGVSGSQFQTPNLILVNTDGLVGFDRTHEFKAFAGYQIPVVDISANIYFRALTGLPWTPTTRLTSSQGNWTTTQDVFLEPRGSRRNGCAYPTGLASETGCKLQTVFDLRLEKVLNVGANRLGLYLDAENLFNSGFPTSVQTRNPQATVNYVDDSNNRAQTVVLLGNPLSINVPRQLTIGGRWSF
ncbi:MAG TPA: TonB-dependent receptor [Vicinamibacterales bacterium]|nr:TonB-dependent receptor [Vicinamibacterales bacterium]